MQFCNPPSDIPERFYHRSFYSRLAGHEVGYIIYLPSGYEEDGNSYPVVYHLHGWQGSESSDIKPLEQVCRNRDAITAIPNLYLPVEDLEHFPLENMIVEEFIPYIESHYRTQAERESRFISGFSMGGGMALFYAIRHPELFSGVTAYAGTYHHYYEHGFLSVDAPLEKAEEYRQVILNTPSDRNILLMLSRNADTVRSTLQIELRIGTEDILHCDNEIMHLHLNALQIPHTYRKFDGAGHQLNKIV